MFFIKKKLINKRKNNFFYKNINIFISLIIIFFIIFYFYFNFSNLSKYTSGLIQKFSDKYSYNLINIEVSKLNYFDKEIILEYFNDYNGKSVFLVPINKISKDILLNKWIKNINIKNNYKNKININIEEETPFGVYNNDNQKLLFSENMIILEVVKNDIKYNDLIQYFGENSINDSQNLISNLDIDFIDNIKSLNYIENRRWNVELDNSIILKLPEKNIKLAIKNYNKIYSNFSNKDLKEIESIDLRIKKQAVIKYKKNND